MEDLAVSQELTSLLAKAFTRLCACEKFLCGGRRRYVCTTCRGQVTLEYLTLLGKWFVFQSKTLDMRSEFGRLISGLARNQSSVITCQLATLESQILCNPRILSPRHSDTRLPGPPLVHLHPGFSDFKSSSDLKATIGSVSQYGGSRSHAERTKSA